MQALLIRKMAQPTSIKRLERLESDYARVAAGASGEMQRLAKLSADTTHQCTDRIKMAGESADFICMCLAKMAQ